MKKIFIILFLIFGYWGWGQTAGDYRSKATGNWNETTTWESYDGSTWSDATSTPGASNNVYIQIGHTVTLTKNEACNDLHINSGSGAILAIGIYTLEINGKLRAYTGAIGIIPGTSTSMVRSGCITSTSSIGKMKFVGTTRTILNTGEWGNNPQAWDVEFASTPGNTLTIQTGFKANNITVSSGTITSTNADFRPDGGDAGTGTLTVKNGTTLQFSNGTVNIRRIATASTTSHFGTLTVENGALLDFSGTSSPTIGATTFTLNGTVMYSGAGAQTLVTKGSNSGGSNPGNYTNLMLSGSGNKTLGVNTTVSNTLTSVSGTTLTIPASFSLTLSPSCQATISGALTNSGTLTLQSPSDNGTSGSLITNGAVTGSISAQRYLTPYDNANDGKWHFISSPVSGQTIFTDLTDFFRFDEDQNYWIYHTSTGNPEAFGDATFVDGRGYLVANSSGITETFTGTPHSADVSPTITYTTGKGEGWNLVGNPFPCAINWQASGWTKNNIENSIYTYDAANVRYTTYNGGALPDSTNGGTRFIPSMQGFFVKANAGSPALTIPLTARLHQNQAFWKKETQANAIPRLMLSVECNGKSDETIIRFISEATSAFDSDYDSPKMSNSDINLYTLGSDDTQLSINTLNYTEQSAVVHLAFTTTQDGNNTITADGLTTFDKESQVLLEDLKLNITQDLISNPVYAFSSATGDDPNRFLLHFSCSFGINDPVQSDFHIYTYGNTIYINNITGKAQNGVIGLYDITGRLMVQSRLGNKILNKLTLDKVSGCYVVKVSANNRAYSQKVILD